VQKVINFFAGNIRLTIECAYPERFVNLCAAERIGLWDLVRIDEVTMGVTMTFRAYKKLKPLLGRVQAEVQKTKKQGIPIFLWRLRKRYALLTGLVIALAVTWIMSLYIWDIRVEGNETVPEAVILSVLDDLGVGIGSFGPGIEPPVIRNQALLELEDVEWLTINRNGSRAVVIIRERTHPPDRIPEDIPSAVYATQSGMIDQMIVWEGTPLVELGDTVEMGQDLITGRVDSLARGTYFGRADARIYARTWHSLSMSMPLEFYEKVYTGEISTKSIIFFGESRINLFFDSGISYITYDKIVERFDFTLPGGIVLPIRRERRIYTQFEKAPHRIDETRAALMLQERLIEQLRAHIGPAGEVLRTDFRVEVGEGMITVHLEAECREQIAALRRLDEEELIITPPITEEEGS